VHELSRFKGLRLRPVVETAGISSPLASYHDPDEEYTASDVVLCDFAGVTKLKKGSISKFHSVVMDARYPRAFFGSRQRFCGENEAAVVRGIASTASPPELSSSSWWSYLANATSDSQPNRLLIDSLSPKDALPFLAHLPNRSFLEVLGLRLAFLMGPSNVVVPGYSLEKGLLAWARRRIKDSEDSGSKFERVKGLFVNLTGSFYCRIEGGKRLEDVDK